MKKNIFQTFMDCFYEGPQSRPNSGGAFQHLSKWFRIMMAEDKKWKCDSTKTIPKISFRTRLSSVEAVSWTKFIKHLRILNWRCLATKYFIPNLVEICSENDSVLTKELNLIQGKFKHQNADQKFTLVSLFCNKEYNFVENQQQCVSNYPIKHNSL